LAGRGCAGYPGEEGFVTQPPPDSKETGYYFALAQIGLEMVAPMLVGLLIDYYFSTMPWATVILLIVGFVGGMLHLVLMVKQHDAEKRRQPPGGAP
jgi:F0F1-type ATP synthase assembly protein I